MTAGSQTVDATGAGTPTPLVTADEASSITLDDRLCLALYTASRSMTARYRVALEDFGLTYPQYLVMVLLWEESAVPVGRIGDRLSLESTGLVTRTRDRSDERLVIISLTRRGRRLQERAAAVTLDICRASGLTIDEQSALVGELRTLDERLKTSTRVARSA